jgi:tryptophanyl-tRNA synthetase
MAADILVYRATHVPVGDDQKQHLELTRDIAQKFNNDFSERIAASAGLGVEMQVGDETVHGYFPITEPLIGGPAPRVMSLRDGTKKMSKSDPSDLSRINLTDDADAISKKIRKAKTDPDALPSEVEGLKGRPEAENLVGIYAGARRQDQGRGARRVRRPAVLGVQAGAGRPRGREAGADRRRDAPHLADPSPMSTAC